MTKDPIRFVDLFKYYKGLPHQLAAIEILGKQIPQSLLHRENEWFSVWSQGGKQIDTSAALKFIQEFEGCHLEAYLCPAGVPTIGWGNTRYQDGTKVKLGDKITGVEADALLRQEVDRIAAKLQSIPHWGEMRSEQQCALISFAYNLGAGFYGSQGFETISARLREKDWAKVPDAMLLYRNPGSSFEAGLRRRREAEGRLWLQGMGLPQIEPHPGRIYYNSDFTTRLTPHVQLGEFALFQEARRFERQHQVDTAAELAAFLERVRRNLGDNPVIITSGYRPPAINASVGGASSSEHLYDAPGVGAVDFYVKGVDVYKVQAFCDKYWDYSVGYGAPKGFVHVGIRKGRPRVRWDY